MVNSQMLVEIALEAIKNYPGNPVGVSQKLGLPDVSFGFQGGD